jgi:glyoxylase-like metal-dependent hydrolase (beta-lactamase superfamily II)
MCMQMCNDKPTDCYGMGANMKIIENVYQLDCAKHSHVFLIKSENSILIDTGMPGLSKQIIAELNRYDVPVQNIKKILLTHHDVDHIGNAKKLVEATGAELYASKEDTPYITGVKNRPGVKRIVQIVVRCPIPSGLMCYEMNQHIGEVKVLPAPGHTPGHTIFQYKNILFTGDLFEIQNGKMQLLPKLMTWNLEEIKKSIGLLKNLDYDWLCPSHGEPIQKGRVTEEFLKQY